MSGRSLNYGRLFVIMGLVIFFVIVAAYQVHAKDIFRTILESNWPSIIIWIFALVGCGAGRYFYSTGAYDGELSVLNRFSTYADLVFMIATYGFAGSTSLALLKGLYLQTLFDGQFFTGFGSFDLTSIFVISSFLLYYSVVNIVRQIINVIYQVDAVQVSKAEVLQNPG